MSDTLLLQLRNGISFSSSADGNVTVSTLQLVPSTLDEGSALVCSASASAARAGEETMIEDRWELQIHRELG